MVNYSPTHKHTHANIQTTNKRKHTNKHNYLQVLSPSQIIRFKKRSLCRCTSGWGHVLWPTDKPHPGKLVASKLLRVSDQSFSSFILSTGRPWLILQGPAILKRSIWATKASGWLPGRRHVKKMSTHFIFLFVFIFFYLLIYSLYLYFYLIELYRYNSWYIMFV